MDSDISHTQTTPNRIRIFQFIVGVMFIVIGVMPFISPESFEESMSTVGVTDMLPMIATIEIMGGVGLLVALLQTRLSGMAALWVTAIMVGAILSHFRVGDFLGAIPASIVLIPCLILVYIHRDKFPVRLLRS